MTKDDGLEIISERVKDFEKNKHVLTKRGHGETNIRTNYIDVLFAALGWNMTNVYEVVREFTQKDTSGTKKVDYAFKINRKLCFFIEAKEASIDLVHDKDAIYQAKRYAYSTNGTAPIVILTDFEEFRVFNVLKAPLYDNPDREIMKEFCFRYTDYVQKWDVLWTVFSREAVETGSIQTLRGKIGRNTHLMDADFLDQITSWRELLAKNIALRNKELSVDDINEAVQRILDRLIFIRNLEDRGIESENTLLNRTKEKANVYTSVIRVFRELDDVYNGLLFKKHFSEDLSLDDKTIKEIIKSMCYPVSPFQFDIIEPEILGRIYEKFLGSKIRLTEGHQAKVEEKIEVRHAGGVYYTPEFIVNSIVEETVGSKIKGLNPVEIENVKILDPACGSGSFLLGAYSCILNYLQDWYSKHLSVKAYKKDYYFTKDNALIVKLDKRGSILENCFFGVDIDNEATEVAIMSLYLKMLDDGFDLGERDLFFGKGHILPNMTSNIKCGNSLIGTEYFADQLDLGLDVLKRVKPFDWKTEYPDIFKNGGFDCLIGNPPYIRIQELNGWASEQVVFYNQNYASAGKGNYDIYVLFLERGLRLLSEKGLLGFILPHKFFNARYGEGIREIIAEGLHLKKLVHFGSDQVFIGATTYTCLLFLTKQPQQKAEIIKPVSLEKWKENAPSENGLMDNTLLNSGEWHFTIGKGSEILSKLANIPNTLETVTDRIYQGLKTSFDKIYILEERGFSGNMVSVYSRHLEKEYLLESDLLHPLMKGGDSKRYKMNRNTGLLILFPYALKADKVRLISENEIKTNFPLTYGYLKECKKDLENREKGRMKNEKWYGYIYPKALDVISQPKIFTPDIAPLASYSLDEEGSMFFTGGAAGGYGILVKGDIDRNYILGLLNSQLLDWCNKQKATSMRGGWYSFESRFIKNLPIVLPETEMQKEKGKLLSALVTQMIETQKLSASSKSESGNHLFEQKISILEKKMNDIVYQLYCLKKEEIEIIEGK